MDLGLDQLLSDVETAQRHAKRSGEDPAVAYKRVLDGFIGLALTTPGDVLADLRRGIADRHSAVLLGASRGGAIWSVRTGDGSWLRLGLGALLLENGARDYRDSIIHAALLVHSAQKLATDLRPILAQVRRLGDSGTTAYQGVIDAVQQGRGDLGEYGYEEDVDRDGKFTYRQVRG